MGAIVAIVGRPNVGKSTLFNRLTESRKAIVEETPGVTRDRHYGIVEWNGRLFSVIDTGGYATGSDDIFEEEIRKQVLIALEEANVICFVVDVQTGITDMDQAVANLLRRSKKPVFLVVNKVDSASQTYYSAEFYGLGFDRLYELSAMSGSGTGDLLDDIVKALPAEEERAEEENPLPRFAIVGRPNVGKSSLTNALLGEERNIVTDIAGTTRDAIDAHYKGYGFEFILVDTAGIRKKARVHEDIEFYSVLRSIKAIEDADVCLMMIDATEGVQKQDLAIFSIIEKNNKGVVVLVNKWDLVEKDTKTAKEFEEGIREVLAPFRDLPILFISAINRQRIHKTLEKAIEVFENRSRRIPTARLNEMLLPIIEGTPPPAIKGKYVKIKYITQLPTPAPTFAFFCNLPQYVKDPYKRFLENQMREHFNFEGVPVRLFFRKK
jgi:GTP-binding protein